MVAAEQLWGEIVEVGREYILPIKGLKWFDLYSDLVLRLERTNRDNALLVPFSNSRIATAAAKALEKFVWPTPVDLFPRGKLLYVAHHSNLTKASGDRPRKVRQEDDNDAG